MKVYIGGKYTEESPEKIQANVDLAITTARKVLLKGHLPIVPHLSHYLHESWQAQGTCLSKDEWYAYDLPFMEMSDSILLLPNCLHSLICPL